MNYFEVFNSMAECLKRASTQLLDMVTDFTDIEKKADIVHNTEHEADGLLHDMVYQLNRAFITPIDREDIMALANGIDNIIDAIEDVANLFDMLSIKSILPEAVDFVRLIVKSSDALAIAIKEFQQFKHTKKLNELVIDVNRIEEEGDKLHRGFIKNLYKNNSALTVLEIIKWKEIYDNMEHVLDGCEDIADMLEGLSVKNS
jgi:predicted phosphate transport protein (TIGR00153 family)